MKIQVLWVAILGMMATMVAQQSVIPVVEVKAASKGQKPATRSALIAWGPTSTRSRSVGSTTVLAPHMSLLTVPHWLSRMVKCQAKD